MHYITKMHLADTLSKVKYKVQIHFPSMHFFSLPGNQIHNMDDTLAYMTQQHWFKQCRSGRFFFKEINTIIRQVCIELIKSDKDFNSVKLSFSNNCCSFELSITQRIFTEYREWTTAHCIVWDRSSLLFVQILMFYTVYIVNIHICLL